jgi:hypothetical protein
MTPESTDPRWTPEQLARFTAEQLAETERIVDEFREAVEAVERRIRAGREREG